MKERGEKERRGRREGGDSERRKRERGKSSEGRIFAYGFSFLHSCANAV
jgi:hypothetical protein